MSAPVDIYVCDEVREVIRLHADLFTDEFRMLSVREQLDRQARWIAVGHGTGDAAAATHITCWHPRLVGWPVEEIMAEAFTLDDARETIAREYGFADWADVEVRGNEPPDRAFEAAVDAILAGRIDDLRELLKRRPELVRERSAYGHQATLLHYVGSNGVETYRQVVPANLVEVTRVLLEAGADVNAEANFYGSGCAVLGLLITSAHPVEAGVMDAMVDLLVAAGAKRDE